MRKRMRKEALAVVGLVVAVLMFTVSGCCGKVRTAIETHAPIAVDQAKIASRYIDDCAAGDQAACGKAKTAVAQIEAAANALKQAESE